MRALLPERSNFFFLASAEKEKCEGRIERTGSWADGVRGARKGRATNEVDEGQGQIDTVSKKIRIERFSHVCAQEEPAAHDSHDLKTQVTSGNAGAPHNPVKIRRRP